MHTHKCTYYFKGDGRTEVRKYVSASVQNGEYYVNSLFFQKAGGGNNIHVAV